VAAAKPSPSPKAESWQLTGNSAINSSTQFLRTKPNGPLIIMTDGTVTQEKVSQSLW